MSRDPAQKWASIAVGAAVVGLVAWMTLNGLDARAVSVPRADASTDAGSRGASPSESADGGAANAANANGAATTGGTDSTADLDAGLSLGSLSLGDAAILPSSGGPRAVKIGVILVTFAGAEGAAANARSKNDAHALADRLLGDARSDFHHAVGGGDSGSAEDIGRITRGTLDPRLESAVFALGSGEISEVLETPRGYWIVKRID